MTSDNTKNVTAKFDPISLNIKVPELRSKFRVGDTTVNQALAFFAIIETPLISVAIYFCQDFGLPFYWTISIIAILTFLLFLTFFKWSLGIKFIMYIINQIKNTDYQ